MSVFQGTEHYLSKLVGKATTDYGMIRDGDKVCVAVSGGKDSLTLLRLLFDRQRFVPVKYKLLAMHIDLGYPRSYSRPLERYFKKLGCGYHIEKVDLKKQSRPGKINCFWCSWNRRKALFQTADRMGFNKVALGHHKDDIVETTLLNLFFQGEFSTMRPTQELFKGKITLIRPLAYAEERMIRKFVREEKLPFDECVCPNAAKSQRTRIKRIIDSLEKTCPEIKTNIFRSLKRVKSDYLL